MLHSNTGGHYSLRARAVSKGTTRNLLFDNLFFGKVCFCTTKNTGTEILKFQLKKVSAIHWRYFFSKESAILILKFREVDHGRVGGVGLLKVCRLGVFTVCFDLQNVTFFHSKLLLDNSASFTSSRSCVKKRKHKTKNFVIFRGA